MMFKSVLSSEISDFLDMRLHTVAKTTYEYDVFILTTFDKHLIEKNYRKKHFISHLKGEKLANRYVFSSQRNEHISVSCIEEIFAKYMRQAKDLHPNLFCAGRYTPHVMRHTTATHLIEAGVPIAVVKNILGHSSIQTTQVYVEITQQTIDKSMEMWNQKWFPTDQADERFLSVEKNPIPEFLQ